jgi:cytochrome c5
MGGRISFPLALAIAVAGCGNGGPQDAGQVPVFEEAPLASGRAIWMQTCRNCHLAGVAGAPALRDYAAWQPRVTKGREALYASAINGIPDAAGGWRMPPRGGNPALSDEQVMRAVDYTLAAVEKLEASRRSRE